MLFCKTKVHSTKWWTQPSITWSLQSFVIWVSSMFDHSKVFIRICFYVPICWNTTYVMMSLWSHAVFLYIKCIAHLVSWSECCRVITRSGFMRVQKHRSNRRWVLHVLVLCGRLNHRFYFGSYLCITYTIVLHT